MKQESHLFVTTFSEFHMKLWIILSFKKTLDEILSLLFMFQPSTLSFPFRYVSLRITFIFLFMISFVQINNRKEFAFFVFPLFFSFFLSDCSLFFVCD